MTIFRHLMIEFGYNSVGCDVTMKQLLTHLNFMKPFNDCGLFYINKY